MAIGPGKYDDVATRILEEEAPAQCVMVLVINGKRGSGMSVKTVARTAVEMRAKEAALGAALISIGQAMVKGEG